MTVTEVLANTVVVPLGVDVMTAARIVNNRTFTLVKVRSSNGAEGVGFTWGGAQAGHLCTLAVRDLLRDKVIGKDPQQVEAIWDAMFRDTILLGRRGCVMRAMSAIDIALWDLMAKEVGVPLWFLLGAYRKDTVPAYASGGLYIKGETPEDLAKEVKGYVDKGFRAVKIKIGKLSPKEDALRVKACREAIGPDVRLLLDANNAWSDADTAIRALRVFEEYDPGWIEDPTLPDELELCAAIAAAVRAPVATGEMEATRWGFKRIIDYKAASILNIDIPVCGGITEWRKIAALAAAYGIPVASHAWAEVGVHMLAVTPNGMWVEFIPEPMRVFNFSLLCKKPLEVRNGELVVPKGLGLDVELDEKAVGRYSVDGWQ